MAATLGQLMTVEDFRKLPEDQVKISTPDGHTVTYRSSQEIPLRMFNNAKLLVDSILE